ncbi:MAG: CehA/McbA family metallohydrolase [Akkermansiaceae bacterium]|nr:CehA/McbA family metallohydrolase [Akkermansiaceae bacterium]
MNHHTPPAITLALLLCVPAAAQKKEAPAMELVSPVPSSVQQGVIEVRIRTGVEGKAAPASIYASLGGSAGVPLTRTGDTGEWGCQIDTTRIPNGGQQLRVITENKRFMVTVPLTVKNPLRHYFADLHSHTSFSDGTLLPEVAHDYARNVAKLDVFSLTDHLESVDSVEWNRMREVAWKANEDGAFVVLPGLEWTKRWGHINIYDPGTRLWPQDPESFYAAIAGAGVLAKFNHPGDGSKSHGGLAYSEAGDKAIQLMEVRSDQEEKAFIRALGLGWHIAPDGSDDTHSPNWGNVKSWTGILAPGLSQQAILAALKARHCYSTLDRNCRLSFEVCGAVMGDILGKPVEVAEVRVAVEDPDAGDKVAKFELFEDGVVVESHEPAGGGGQWAVSHKAAPGSHHYFVKVTQADGDMLWSAPVWLAVVVSWK